MQVDIAPEGDHPPLEDSFTIESTTLDHDVYASNYTSLTKLNRLMFVAKHCPSLEVDALRITLGYVKQMFNVQPYQEIVMRMTEACNHSELECPAVDATWIEAALMLEKLDTDLKNYKSNSIKENIRCGHDDIGDHYFECRDLNNALKCYSRARDLTAQQQSMSSTCALMSSRLFNVRWISVFRKCQENRIHHFRCSLGPAIYRASEDYVWSGVRTKGQVPPIVPSRVSRMDLSLEL